MHGGLTGGIYKYDANIIYENGIQKLHLSFTDPHGHNNFSGTVSAQVTYALLDNNSLNNLPSSYNKTTPSIRPIIVISILRAKQRERALY